jgi:hypothetical protein
MLVGEPDEKNASNPGSHFGTEANMKHVFLSVADFLSTARREIWARLYIQ